MAKLRVKEAIEQAEKNGLSVKKIELAEKLWPGRKKVTLQVNMTNLCNGTTKRIDPETVEIICRELNTTPNFLFGIEQETPGWLETLWNVNPRLAEEAQNYLGINQ